MNPKNTCDAFVPGEMIEVGPTCAGKLSSLTFAVKELYDVAGFVTGAGNPHWKNTHPVAGATAPVVSKLLDEGATLAGKTISDEMAFSLDGENTHYGTPLNPKYPDRIPGGSSSGSASAVAGGLVDFALGTDTAGSNRIPASYCGIYGFRPTHGAVSLEGVHPMAPSFDVVGWFARAPDILAGVGSVLLDITIPEFGADRFVVARDLPGGAGYGGFIKKLSGMNVEEVEIGNFSTWIEALRNIQWWELNRAHGTWIYQNLDKFGEEIRGRLEKICSVKDREMEEHKQVRKQLIRQIENILSPGTIMIFPTAPGIAPLKGRSVSEARASRLPTMKHTCIATVAGLPQVSMPLSEESPIGISFMGAKGQDGQLLAAARFFGNC